MNDDHKRRSAINSRSGYKSKATRIRKVITKYESDSSLLSLCTALPEIEHNLNILPDLRDNIENVQETIIQLTRNETDREEEIAELRAMLDDMDESEAKLIELRKKVIASKPDSESENVKGMFQFLSARMDEQLLQQEVDRRVSEEMNRAERKAEQEKFEATLNLLLTSNNSVRLSTPKSKRTGHPNEDDEEDDEELQDTSAKLKGLAVPEFSGDYSEWISFKNLFTSIIDKNSNLSNSRKLHYLNSYLKGEAKSRISHLPISNVNYNVAWNILMTAYDDMMGIANSHIKAFLSTPRMVEPSAEAMRRTHAVVMSSVDALDAMNMEQRDIWLIHLILEKLDNESKTLWSRTSYKKIPSWSDFTDFLRERYKTMEQVAPSGSQKSTKKQEMKSMSAKQSNTKWSSNLATTTSSTPTTTSAIIPCACCGKSNHRTVKCYKFRGLRDAKRLEIVQQAKLCINCLDPNHSVEKCQSSSCKKCEEKHSTWLHYAIHPESPKPEPSTSTNLALIKTEITTENIQPSAVSLNCANQTLLPYVLLATAVIQVQNDNGDTLLCRAVLDSGSQANIITEEVCQMLKLSKRKSNCRLEGIGAKNTPSPYQVTVNFGPRGFNRWTQTDCIVQEKITGRHPAVKISTSLPIPSKLVMADPQWNQPHQIDILIGGQHYWELVYDQTIHLGSGLPILKRSAFGWLVVGQIAPIPTNSSITQNCNLTTLESIDATLKRFHEIEDLPSSDRRQEENDVAQKIYSETVSRDSTGRFIVHLPFTDDVENLASNRSTAAKQLYFLERKLNASQNMRAKYEEIFGEYLSLGIIERVPTEELSQKSYYLPYHGVYKESSQTTKLRVVFNGSSKSNNNFSLNDTLLTGPTVQPSLVEILWRFRLHPYAMTCDITKMYLQFLIDPEQKNYQRFLFRSVKGGTVEEYRFRTLCFGIKSSPFLATRSLVQLAEEDGEQFPVAREVLLTSFYVDDCLVSAESVEKLHLIRKELTDLLQRAQLQLAKWTSNVQSLSDEVHQELKEVVPDHPNEGSVSTLGLCWSPEVDHLSYKYSPETDNSNPTMRKVFSIASRIYDPLGLIGPFTVNAKQIMQTLWRLKGKWDSPVHDEVIDDWNAFIKSMEYIPNIKIPRWVSDFVQVTRRELHLFTDASSKAYGAVVYLVTEDASGARCSRLLTAKSRVAPLKGATIPKLELCAAELGSILLKAVRNALQCEIYFCWTDATIVLCQIHAPDRRERFVKNRLKIILENTVSERWNHVPTKENPADIISRGVTAEQLMELKLWWTGPDWLQENSKFWPKLPEVKTVMISSTTVVTGPGIREYLMKQSNSFSYIRRTLAWVLRFVHNTRAKGNYLAGPLQPEELQNAEVHLVKFEQQEFLRYDIRVLEGDIQKPLSKPLRNLGPFLDENGVIRVGGRLENADLNRETKNPMILPGGPLAKRIVSHEHHRMWHAGPRLIMMGLRRKYWPLFGRRMIKGTYSRCVICIKRNPHTCHQMMGQLPASRVNLTLPFDCTGIDYAGPVSVKANKLRKSPTVKTYIAVFVCMALKAVHLEVVGDLSTETFMAAFRRFTSRRGTPTKVYSDNGTNFVGAANEIKTFFSDAKNREKIIDATSGDGISWQFIPPRAPHWGGLWEAAVKSLKYHFNRVMSNVTLTYEELITVVTQIEGVLNSRPLTADPMSTEDPQILTPAHYLRMAPITSLPDWNLEDVSRLNRWQLTQKLYQHITKRWKSEYLLTLQRRTKWDKSSPNLEVGDVVLLIDQATAGVSWPLARVIAIHPGHDGKVRLVTIQTVKGTYKRPVQLLAKLPTSSEESEFSN